MERRPVSIIVVILTFTRNLHGSRGSEVLRSLRVVHLSGYTLIELREVMVYNRGCRCVFLRTGSAAGRTCGRKTPPLSYSPDSRIEYSLGVASKPLPPLRNHSVRIYGLRRTNNSRTSNIEFRKGFVIGPVRSSLGLRCSWIVYFIVRW